MSSIVRDARKRIKEVRQKDVEVLVLKDGKPVPNAKVAFRMKKHQFLFGAHCYNYGKYPTEAENERYTELFTDLLNYTFAPFHWGGYEPERHVYNEPYVGNLVRWSNKHEIKIKLHALIWHEVCPKWLKFDDDVGEIYRDRISRLMIEYADQFDFFDLVNETVVNYRFDNPVSRWIDKMGPINVMKWASGIVRSFKPDAKLIYGEWNVHIDAYTDLLREMRDADVDIDYLGVQSHMHSYRWTFEEVLSATNRAAAFGWPLQFPELSICSGKPARPIRFTAGAKNEWVTNEGDFESQAEYAEDLYTVLFSHPAVEALSWFDFADGYWLNAPSGLVSKTLDKKPVYNTLHNLIKKEWFSNEDEVTGSEGWCRSRLFTGNYDITIDVNGETTTVNEDILRESFYSGWGEPGRIVIKL